MFTDDGFLRAVFDTDGDYPGRAGFWGRLVVKFMIAYVLVAIGYREELLFRHSSIPVTGEVVEMFELPSKKRLDSDTVQVKYRFRDPETGAARINSVAVSRASLPVSDHLGVQYIPGESFRSRLAIQADPVVGWLFLALNTILAGTAATWLGFVIWEANRRPLTRQQRAVAALHRERAKLQKMGFVHAKGGR